MFQLIPIVTLMLLFTPLSAVAQAATPTTAAPAAPAASQEIDPFYVLPSPLPTGNPGALIRWEPMPAPPGLRTWRILYHSTALDGSDVAVSGVVFAPDRPAPPTASRCWRWATTPLVLPGRALRRWTRSNRYPGRLRRSTSNRWPALLRGDLLPWPPIIRASELATASIPSLWGRRRVTTSSTPHGRPAPCPAWISPRTRSSGDTRKVGMPRRGRASWLPSYAPDLRISGVILGAPAAEPGLVLAAATSGQAATAPTPLTGYIVTLVYAWSHVYPEAAAAPAFTPAALAKIDLVTRECIPDIAAAYSDRPLTDYVDAAVLMAAPWDILLERNAAGRKPISAPVMVVQGTADPLVPPPRRRRLSSGCAIWAPRCSSPAIPRWVMARSLPRPCPTCWPGPLTGRMATVPPPPADNRPLQRDRASPASACLLPGISTPP